MPLLLFFLCYIVIFLLLFFCICRFSRSYEVVEQPETYQLRLSESAKEQLLNHYLKDYELKYDAFQNVFLSCTKSFKMSISSSDLTTKVSFFQVPFFIDTTPWNLQIAFGQYGAFYGFRVMLVRSDSYSASKQNPLCRMTIRQYRNDYLFAEQTTKQYHLSTYVLMDSLKAVSYETELCIEFKQDYAREAFLKGLRQNGIPQKQYEVYRNKIYLYFSADTKNLEFDKTNDLLEPIATIARYHDLTKFLSSEIDKLLYLCQYEPDFLQHLIHSICDIAPEEGR